jgi:large subunit ribosomal protein L30
MKIVIVRLKGLVKVDRKIQDTLSMLRLRRKNVCVIVDDTKEVMGMIKKVENYIAYGKIDKETLKKLIEKRAEPHNKRKVKDEDVDSIFTNKKKLQDLGIKPFFRLHPPRGGFKKSTKVLWPKGILGNQDKDINKLIKKML